MTDPLSKISPPTSGTVPKSISETSVFRATKGINQEVVNQISDIKNEPDWMRKFRLKSLEEFQLCPTPTWAVAIDPDFQVAFEFRNPTDQREGSLDGAVQKDLCNQGIIFTDTDTAVREHPELVREYFGSIIPSNDSKFAALNGAVWSGGTFIYVPKGVQIQFPLQASWRNNAESISPFERTLIVVDEGASLHYFEGCTALMNPTESLLSTVAEVLVKRKARCRCTTIRNWANHVNSFVTQHAYTYSDATMQWFDVNVGSKRTIKRPAIHMMEPGARGEILALALIDAEQQQDASTKLVHRAPNTMGQIVSKSISSNGGRDRGTVCVETGAHESKSSVTCNTLVLNDQSHSITHPHVEVLDQGARIDCEAKVSRIDEDQLFYMRSRGLTKAEASTMIVNGFIEPLLKELPMEYAVEMNRLIQLQIEGSQSPHSRFIRDE